MLALGCEGAGSPGAANECGADAFARLHEVVRWLERDVLARDLPRAIRAAAHGGSPALKADAKRIFAAALSCAKEGAAACRFAVEEARMLLHDSRCLDPTAHHRLHAQH